MSHDQRFKEGLREFFQEFLKLFYPDIDFPDGERREADVVAKLETFVMGSLKIFSHFENGRLLVRMMLPRS